MADTPANQRMHTPTPAPNSNSNSSSNDSSTTSTTTAATTAAIPASTSTTQTTEQPQQPQTKEPQQTEQPSQPHMSRVAASLGNAPSYADVLAAACAADNPPSSAGPTESASAAQSPAAVDCAASVETDADLDAEFDAKPASHAGDSAAAADSSPLSAQEPEAMEADRMVVAPQPQRAGDVTTADSEAPQRSAPDVAATTQRAVSEAARDAEATARAAHVLAQQLTQFHLAHQQALEQAQSAAAGHRRATSSPPAVMAANVGAGALRSTQSAAASVSSNVSLRSTPQPFVMLDLPVVAPPSQHAAVVSNGPGAENTLAVRRSVAVSSMPLTPLRSSPVASSAPAYPQDMPVPSVARPAPFAPFTRMLPVQEQDRLYTAETKQADAEYELHREAILKAREERNKHRLQRLKDQKEYLAALDNFDKAESEDEQGQTAESDASHAKEDHSSQRRLQQERPQSIRSRPIVQSPSEMPTTALAERPMQISKEPDVILNIPEVSVGLIGLEVNNLAAHVDVHARVANKLVILNAGIDVSIERVKLEIRDVHAEAYLRVRLDNVRRVVEEVGYTKTCAPFLGV